MAELQADFELLPRETLEANMELTPRSEIDATFEINIATKGDKGDAGADATINGVSTLTLTTGTGLVLNQSGNTATLSVTSPTLTNSSAQPTSLNIKGIEPEPGDTNPYAVSIGMGSRANTGSVAIGYASQAYGENSVVIGTNVPQAGPFGTAIGNSSHAQYYYGTAIGYHAQTLGSYAIQIGYGQNQDDSTLNVGFYNDNNPVNYQLLDGTTGLIPDSRISSNIARTSALTTETTNRQNADNNLQQQIDAITASSDVKDIVGTYAQLQSYDTSTLGNNDIIKVLQDETQNDETTYYRWNATTQTFTLIGEEGPYYTKSEANSTFVPQTRTVNGKALSSNISLNASDVGALPDSTVIPTVNNATLTIQKNGTEVATFTANSSIDQTANITVPTNTNELTNGAGFITSSDIPVTDVTVNGTSVVSGGVAVIPKIPTSSDYWTVGTSGVSDYQTTYSKKTIFYTASGAQDNGFKMLASSDTAPSSTVGAWSGRCLIGNEKRTFLLGTARNSASGTQSICGLGAHTWGSASSQTSAAWDNVYIQPDGSTGVYLGGNGWRGSSGWFRTLNNNSGSAAYRTSINTGTNSSPAWKTVLPNNATGSNSVLFTPTVSTTHTYTYATSVNGTVTANYGTSYGYGTTAAGYATALGYNAKATGSGSIQIGQGTNSTANTFSVGLSSSLNVQLLDSTGVIPAGRLNIASSVDGTSTNSQMVGAKLFYDTVGNIETLIQNINSGS